MDYSKLAAQFGGVPVSEEQQPEPNLAALAAQFGGVPAAQEPRAPSRQPDMDAIAAKFGGTPVAPSPSAAPEPVAAAPYVPSIEDQMLGMMGVHTTPSVAPAPAAPPAPAARPAPTPFRDKREALDEAVNLLEEGADRTEVFKAFGNIGVRPEEITRHGQARGSAYFRPQRIAPAAVTAAPPTQVTPTGTISAWEPGLLQSTANIFKRADANLKDTSTSLLFSAGVLDADQAAWSIRNHARQREAAAPSYGIQRGMEAIGSAKTYGDAAEAMYRNPMATMSMLVDSLLATTPSLAATIIAAPAGAVLRGGTAFLGSAGMEYAAVLTDVLQDNKVDLLDAPKVAAALRDPKILEEAKEKGAKRGLIVGAFDGLSMGLAGRFMRPANELIAAGNLSGTAAKKATAAAWAKELALQTAAGAGGEFAAQKATGEDKPAEVLLEALAGGVTAPLEVMSSMRETRHLEAVAQRGRALEDLAARTAPPAPAAPTTAPAAPTTAPAAPAVPEDLGLYYDNLISQYLADGFSEEKAMQLAGQEILSGGFTRGRVEPDTRGVEPSVPVDSERLPGESERVGVAAEPAESGTVPVAAPSEPAGGVAGGAPSVVGALETPTEPAAVPPAVTPVTIEDIAQRYTADVAEAIVNRSSQILQEGVDQGAMIPFETALAQAETEITEALPAPTGEAPAAVAPPVTEAPPVTSAFEAPPQAPVVSIDQVVATTPTSQLPVNPETGMKPPGTRGRKAIERTPEEQAAAEAQRKARQKVGRDAIRTAEKAQKIIERPFNLEDYDSRESAEQAGVELQRQRDFALAEAVGILNNRNLGPDSKAKQIARNLLDHPSVDTAERNRALKSGKPTTTAKMRFLEGSVSWQPDNFYRTVTNAQQGIDYIIKTGNAFERTLARRIKPFLDGVQVIVVYDPMMDIPTSEAREAFRGAVGLYEETGDRRIIYLNGDRVENGLSNLTFLHEALHGATMAQLNTWYAARDSLNPRTRAVINDLFRLMLDAYVQYGVAVVKNRSDPVLDKLFKAKAFTELKEFVAYGLSQPEMQDFLLRSVPGRYQFIPGKQTLVSNLLTKFVDTIRRLFGMAPQHASAFQDLVVITDRLLSIGGIPTTRAEGIGLSKKLNKQNKTLEKVARSHDAADINAGIGTLVMETRSVKDALRLLNSVYDALSVGSLRKILPTMTTEDITRWVGNRVANIRAVNTAVQDMAGMRIKMIRELAERVPEWIAFGRKYEAGGRALGDVMHSSSLLEVDPTLYPTLTMALNHDAELVKLRAAYQAAIADPTKSQKERATLKGTVTKRENALKAVYEGGTITNPYTGEKYTVAGWEQLGQYGYGEGQDIYRMARDAYKKTFDLHQKLLIDKINKSSIPGTANNPNTPKGKLIAQITQTFQEAQQLGVYFPLMRYGNFWLRIGEGKAGEFYMFESAAARNNYARKRAEELKKTYEEVLESKDFEVGDNLRQIRNDVAESSQMLKTIFAALDDNAQVNSTTGKANITDVDAIKDQVYQMYLMTLPDNDMRKRFTHRQGKTGFSADVLRNFIVSQHTAANQLSRLAYADKIRLSVASSYAELVGNPDKLKLAAFVDEIALRAGAEMTPQAPAEFDWNRLASLGNQAVFYYMLTSPKSALVQMTQLPLVGLPVLTAKYGAVETAKVTARYSYLFNKFGLTKEDQNGNIITEWGQPSINDSPYVNKHPDPVYRAALKQAWQAAQDKDIFMSTYTADMTARAQVPTGKYEGVLKRSTRATLNFMGGAFHHMERITREIMYMSTFELEYARATKEGLDPASATARGIDAATKTVYEALFNYSQYNKPRIMKAGPLPKLATQFMTYPLQMTSYLVRNFFGMLPYLNKEGKRDAAIKFFGTIGMTGLFAGVVGLPGYSAIMGMAEGIRELFRPDMDAEGADEYYDEDDEGNPLGKRSLDLWFREWFIPTYFGPNSSIANALGLTDEQAFMLQRGVKMGPISALTDLNIGASVSLDGLWFRDDTPAASSKAGFQEMVFKLAGPFGSMGEQIAGAFDDFNNGHMNRGVEKLLPAFFRGGAKAVRLSTEGERTRQGAELRDAEWYTTGKLLGASLGFQSTEVAEIQKKNFIAKSMVMEIEKAKQRVLGKLDLAVQQYENDSTERNADRIEEALKDIERFNYKNGMLAISGDTIRKSLEGRAKRRGEAIEGLMVTPAQAPFVYPLLERSTVPQK